jgi:hypothetical protein
MLKELSKLSSGLLLMQGHVADLETARRLARSCATQAGGRVRAEGRKRRPGLAESVMLAPIWIVTPTIVLLAAAALVHPL